MAPKLITLGQLLHTFEPAVLVKAIEEHGLYGWDQFGNWGEFKKKSDTASLVLAKLSEVYYAKIEAARNSPPKSWHAVLTGKNLIGPLHHLGWIDGQLPDFEKIKKSMADKPVFIPLAMPKMRDDSVISIIASLLFMAREQPILQRGDHPLSQAQIIEYLTDKFQGFPGVTKSNLEKVFSEANSYVKTFGTAESKIEKSKKAAR